MGRLFDADNAFFRFMTRVADALILNLFFLITSLPIVTMGASYTALYYYCTKAVGNEEGYLWKSYWKSFKTNFVQGFLLEAIFAIVGVILYVDIKYLYNKAFTDGTFGWNILFFIVVGMAVLAITTFMYAFPVLSRFDNTTFHIIRNAAFMSIRHMAHTVPLLLIFGVALLVGWLMFPVSLFFIVGAWVYISSIFFYKVLDRYMPKDEHYDEDYYLGAEGNADTTAGVEDISSEVTHTDAVNGIAVEDTACENYNDEVGENTTTSDAEKGDMHQD